MKICVLGSGSSGNCIYINSLKTSILIDAGFSGKEICRRLNYLGVNPLEIDAIILSHEHTDHIKGIKGLSAKFKFPIFANKATKLAVEKKFNKLRISNEFKTGRGFFIDELYIESFSVSHDAAEPVGFNIFTKDFKIGIATDLGYATHLVKERLKHSDLLILESNHDPDMLINGPYPWEIKQRIKGNKGHLSNSQCETLVREIIDEKTKYLILAHISETNNYHDLAHLTMKKSLEDQGLDKNIALIIAQQNRAGEIFTLSK